MVDNTLLLSASQETMRIMAAELKVPVGHHCQTAKAPKILLRLFNGVL